MVVTGRAAAIFERGLQHDEWVALETLKDSAAPNWWRDLLDLWVPSGQPAGDHGLRLALRHGALNFYRRGQSIGRVGFRRPKRGGVVPRMKIHRSYVGGEGHQGDYCIYGVLDQPYPGRSELLRWIGNSARHHGPEKWGVDDVVGGNAGVIDLEMATPGNALRVDVASLHPGWYRPCLILWEAKPLHSSELRRAEGEPEIVRQIAGYTTFCAENRTVIEDNYRIHCKALARLAAWAGKTDVLSPLVAQAAEQGVSLDTEVRLLLFRGVKRGKAGERVLMHYADDWPDHRAKLGALMINEAEDPADLELNPERLRQHVLG